MVASGPLPATDRSAAGPPKSITDSKDGTLGRFELLPHQFDIDDIELDIELDIQEELWAPSDAPELEPLKLPSRVAVASLIVPAPLMSAATAANSDRVLRAPSTVVRRRPKNGATATPGAANGRRYGAVRPSALTAPYRAYGALPLTPPAAPISIFLFSRPHLGGKAASGAGLTSGEEQTQK